MNLQQEIIAINYPFFLLIIINNMFFHNYVFFSVKDKKIRIIHGKKYVKRTYRSVCSKVILHINHINMSRFSSLSYKYKKLHYLFMNITKL